MILFIFLLGTLFFLSMWMGYRRVLRLEDLSRNRLIYAIISVLAIFTLLAAGQWMGLFTQVVSARVTMGLYTIVGGFFCGFSFKMIQLRKKLGSIEYICRSFWSDAAPNIICVLLIGFGFYRMGILTEAPYTGIGLTSGLSLISFGFFGITVKIVPEFRKNGILILDQLVPWKRVVAYNWRTENVIKIDYYTEQKELTDFTTYISPEDELEIERLLAKKLREHEEDRMQVMDRSRGGTARYD